MVTRRRGRGEGGIYRTGDGRWRAVVDLGWRDGKRRRKYLSGRTRQEVAAKLRAEQQTIDAGLPATDGRPMTVATWTTTWLEGPCADRVRPRTLERYRSLVDLWIVPQVGRHRLPALRPEHLELLYRSMLDKGLAPATVRQTHATIHRALRVAVQRRYVASNVADLVQPPAVPRNEVRAPTEQECRQILAAAQGQPTYARWAVALSLGLRQGEALGLRWEDADLDQGVLRIRRALQRQVGVGLVLVEPKSRAGRRTLALPGPLVDALREHRTTQIADRLAAGSDWNDLDLIFCQSNGRPIDPRSDHRSWQHLLKAAEVGPFRLHDARHAAASLLLAQGVGLRTVMEILGHSQISLTADTYGHVAEGLMRDAADRMQGALWA